MSPVKIEDKEVCRCGEAPVDQDVSCARLGMERRDDG